MHEMVDTAAVHPGRPPAFVWKDFSRFVELHPVTTGWLVLWGTYTEAGKRKLLSGNQIYVDLPGARRRMIDAVIELTGRLDLAEEALTLLNRTRLPLNHQAVLPPEPL